MIQRLLAHCTVTDLECAEDWYTRLLGRGPDVRPTPGLIEWQLGDSFGLLVWSEPDRAGQSSVVFEETDLDEAAAHAIEVGLLTIVAGGAARIVQLADPDGNRVVLVATSGQAARTTGPAMTHRCAVPLR